MSAHPDQPRLVLRTVEVVDPGQKVDAPDGIIYSTDPRRALATDGHHYFLKGPGREIVFAELVSYQLAEEVQLPVPQFGIARVEGQTFFVSGEVRRRNIDLFLRKNAIANPEMLALTTAFDVWIANHDRNLMNFVGELVRDSPTLRLIAIDFEKAACLCERTPTVSVPLIAPARFWPRGPLGEHLRGTHVPLEFCARIAGIGRDIIGECVRRAVTEIGEVPWAENSAGVLESRARDIVRLCQEVWR